MDDVINEFLVESFENLDQLDQDLVDLEQDPSNTELLSNVFRIIHTIKGTCGFLGFSKLESLAHVGENLLSRLRDGELGLNPEITSGVLAMFDGVRRILGCIESDQNEGDEDFTALKDKLTRLTKGETGISDASAEAAPEAAPAETATAPQEESAPPKSEEPEETQPEAPAPAAAVTHEEPEINEEMEAVVNEFLVESPFIVIGRKGSAGEINLSDKNGFPIDTTFYISENEINDEKIDFNFFGEILFIMYLSD